MQNNMTDEQLARLPRYAVDEINSLRRNLHNATIQLRLLEARLEGREDSPIKLYKRSDTTSLKKVPALEGDYFFYFKPDDGWRGGDVELGVSLREDCVVLHSNTEMRIIARAANSIAITGGAGKGI